MDIKAILSILIFVGTYFFIAIEKTPKVYVALSGVLLLILFKVYNFEEIHNYVDWDTVSFLAGTFLIVRVIEISGFFNYLSLKIIKKLNYDPVKIFFFFPLLSWFLSGFIGSIAVLSFLSPLTYTLCRILRMDSVPLIIAEVCLANVGGAGTLMGDPPNVILASMFNLGFTVFFINNFLLSLISGIGAIFVFYKMNEGYLLKVKERIDKKAFEGIVPEEAIEDKILSKHGIYGLISIAILLIFRDFIKRFFPLSIGICSLLPTIIFL